MKGYLPVTLLGSAASAGAATRAPAGAAGRLADPERFAPSPALDVAARADWWAYRPLFRVKSLYATILTRLGLDPNGLSSFFNGLDETLVGVEGAEPIHQVLA